ncbi:MAG: hypothetical protein Kow0059_19640 [Candidatus Sumerlaeia bacterium]
MSRRTQQNLLREPVINFHPHRVLYAEVDQMGWVYYGNYFAWFEGGRGELLRRFGMTYRRVEEEWGLALPVTHCEATYHHGARYDDLVLIETRLTVLTPVQMDFEYRVFDAGALGEPDGAAEFMALAGRSARTLVEGKTRHVFVGRDGRVKRGGQLILDLIGSQVAEGPKNPIDRPRRPH